MIPMSENKALVSMRLPVAVVRCYDGEILILTGLESDIDPVICSLCCTFHRSSTSRKLQVDIVARVCG